MLKVGAVAAALVCLGPLSGCAGPVGGSGRDTTEAGAATSTTPTPSGARSSAPAAPPDHEPVSYKQGSPDRTVRTARGYLVNTYVPKDSRSKATTLTTSDGAHLSAPVMGGGTDPTAFCWTLLVVSPGGVQGAVEKQVREVHAASVARKK
ncbi:hypothetical protein [Streptomyces reniochalinae]|uniref:hypothetical protein n=1 Tax=Streptomyces reniochalinae TaxID=2250578 RepID=UPI001FE93D23|nr:hypothetical protein [Streptomyces reniochalinae]